MLAGVAFGQRGFAGVAPVRFRRRVVELPIGVSALTAARAALSLAN